MKKLFFILLVSLLSISTKAQLPFFKTIQGSQLVGSNTIPNYGFTWKVLPFRNNYFIAYSLSVVGGNPDIGLAKVDSAFNIIWSHKSTYSDADYVSFMCLDADSNILILGEERSSGSINEGSHCVVYDTLGNKLCRRSIFNSDIYRPVSQPIVLGDSTYYGLYYSSSSGFTTSIDLEYVGDNCYYLSGSNASYNLFDFYPDYTIRVNDSIVFCLGSTLGISSTGFHSYYPAVNKLNYRQHLNYASITFENTKNALTANESTGVGAACKNNVGNIVLPATYKYGTKTGLWMLECNPQNGDTVRTKYIYNTHSQGISYIHQNADFTYSLVGTKNNDTTTAFSQNTNVVIYQLDSAFNLIQSVEYNFLNNEILQDVTTLPNDLILLSGLYKTSATAADYTHYFMKVNSGGCIKPIIDFTYTYQNNSLHLINTSNTFFMANSVSSFFLVNDSIQINSINPTIAISIADSIKVQYIILSACGSDTLTKYIDNTVTVGVNEIILKKKLIVKPNPASNFIQIELENTEIKKVEIYSVIGTLLIKNNSNNKLIDLTNLEDGIYLLKVTDLNENEFVRSIVKTKSF